MKGSSVTGLFLFLHEKQPQGILYKNTIIPTNMINLIQ